MKKLIALAFVFLCVITFCVSVSAEVATTNEPTDNKNIYIAGNSNLYPLEFYNKKTKTYEGILPDIYERISNETGIEFSYVSADSKNQQKQLAKNFQVEVVSAYIKGDISVSKEIELFSYNDDTKTQTVCIGFTKIINPDIALTIENAINGIDKSTWLSAAMKLENQYQTSNILVLFIIAICVLVAALVFLVVYIVKKHRKTNRRHEEKMIDLLTGIGNLMYFEKCYLQHISQAMRSLYYVSYIAIDIQKIETYFGKSQSEEIQRYAANIITTTLNDNDFVARIDDGVFAVCFMCPDVNRAQKTMTEIIKKLNDYSEEYTSDSGAVFRCGIYPLDKQNISVETAIFNARQGYVYATNEKQNVRLCDQDVLDRVTLKSKLQKKISSAIDNEEFNVYLQFIYDIESNNLCGAEVLSRWHSLDEGVLSPANYVEDMKNSGMIDRFDFYVLEKSCQVLSDWSQSGLEKLYISCNITRTTLSKTDFLKRFIDVVSKYNFDKNNLIVELTEDSLVDDTAVAYKNILAIKEQGIKIALDDFGSGYTSFSDLCDYPIDIIKIDRDIVIKSKASRGYAVLTSIIRMAHALGIEVACEGVETLEENNRVIESDCDYIQGFYYSRVLPLENALEFYKNKE